MDLKACATTVKPQPIQATTKRPRQNFQRGLGRGVRGQAQKLD